jgi:hypothetical protein
MAKLKQITIGFSYKKGQCGVCNKDDKDVVEVGGDTTKLAICTNCAMQISGIHSNMLLMKSAG